MRRFLKVSEGINVDTVMAQIHAQPELWDAHSLRRTAPGTPHSGMQDIWIRYNAPENIGPNFNHEHEAVFYPAYYKLPALKQIIFNLMAAVEGVRLGGVLITKIPSGSGIAPHEDHGWHVDHYDKFYVSLQSASGAKFICHVGPEVLEPRAGECWRFDNHLMHSVANESAVDRITLIVCIRTEKYGSLQAVERKVA